MAARTSGYNIVAFFICINVSMFLLASWGFLPVSIPPLENPQGIIDNLMDIDGSDLLIGGVAITASAIISKIVTGGFVAGGTVGLAIWVITKAMPIIQWVIFGVPALLTILLVPPELVTTFQTLLSVVWAWFVLSMIGQRNLKSI